MKLKVFTQAWLILGTFFGLAFLAHPSAWLRELPRPDTEAPPPPDFIAFYTAGKMVREEPGRLYDSERQAEIQSQITGDVTRIDGPRFMPFSYPPATALFFAPFTALSYSAAFTVMFVLNIVLAGIGLHLLAGRLSLSTDASSLIVLCFSAALSTYQTLSNGQVSFLVFLLYVMLISSVLSGRATAGIWAGLLVIKPTTLPVVGLWLLARRDWKTLGYAVATGSTILLMSFSITGFGALSGFLRMSSKMASGQYMTVHTQHMPNLRALSQFLGAGDWLWMFLSVVVLVLLFIRCREVSDASCAALLLAAILVTPHVHVQDLSLLWIVVALRVRSYSSISSTFRRTLFGITLVGTAALYAAMTNNVYLPIVMVPVSLFLVFLNFIFRNGFGTINAGHTVIDDISRVDIRD